MITLYLLNYFFFKKAVIIIDLSHKKGYIKNNIFFTMNLKVRGITYGDLLIILIIILFTTTLVKSINKDKKTTLNSCNQEKAIYSKTLLSKLNIFSV